ncbi:MAG: DnaJ domain-containing protein [Bdellovibrionota bacterium]
MALKPEDEKARKLIQESEGRFLKGNYYEVLGIQRKAADAEVKKSYFTLAKTYHPDTFAGKDLGELAPKAGQIFARITEAYNTLLDAEKRKKYDDVLDGKAIDDNKAMEMAQIALRAELEFQKGEILAKTGNFVEAEGYFRNAVKLKPEEGDFWAYLGWSVYKKRQGDQNVNRLKAKRYLDKALEIKPNCDRAFLFMGLMAKVENQTAVAFDFFRKAVAANPKNMEAVREVKAYESQLARVTGKVAEEPKPAPEAKAKPEEPKQQQPAKPGKEKIDLNAALASMKKRQ